MKPRVAQRAAMAAVGEVVEGAASRAWLGGNAIERLLWPALILRAIAESAAFGVQLRILGAVSKGHGCASQHGKGVGRVNSQMLGNGKAVAVKLSPPSGEAISACST